MCEVHGLIPDRDKIMQQAIKLLGVTFHFPYAKTAYGEKPEDLEDCPFFTEGFLYSLMGKEDARTILAMIGNLLNAAGINDAEQDEIVNATYRKTVREREEAATRAERLKKNREARKARKK